MAQFDRGDGLVGTLGVKAPCRVATTANITLYGLQTIDGITVLDGDRVLVKDQTNPIDNGIWYAAVGTWDRAPDLDGIKDVLNGTLVVVANGTVSSGYIYRTVCAADAVPGANSLTFVVQNVTHSDLAGPTGSSLVGHIASGTGAVARTLQSKLRDVVSVRDFSVIGDGVTDDTAALQTCLDSLPNGGTIYVPANYSFYIASNLTIPKNISLVGALKNVSEQKQNSFNYTQVTSTIYLNSAATIILKDGASISGFQIINSAIKSMFPITTIGNVAIAIAAFAGTAITANGQDVKAEDNCILGFNKAFYSEAIVGSGIPVERTKLRNLLIDCLNGIHIVHSTDVARFNDIHCFPLISSRVAGATARRIGSAFKVDTSGDAIMFSGCFAYGWDVGFDITTDYGTIFSHCAVDSATLSVGQIGFKFTGTATSVMLNNCMASGLTNGVYINCNVSYGYITISDCDFHGNTVDINSDKHTILNINGNSFKPNSGTGTQRSITLTSTVVGSTNIVNNSFSSGGTAYSIDAIPLAMLRSTGNVYVSGTVDLVGVRYAVEGAGGVNGSIGHTYTSANASNVGHSYTYRNSTGTLGTPAVSGASALPFKINGQVYTGTAFGDIASFGYRADGAASAGSTPGSIFFSTTPSGATTPVERWKLNKDGGLDPVANNVYPLGNNTTRWSVVYTQLLNVAGDTNPIISTKTAAITGAGAGAGTITNAPVAGNPTKWLKIDDAGTTRYIPAW